MKKVGISSKAIGHIDVRKEFSLVDIAAEKVDLVLTSMQRSRIRKQEVMVEIDSAPKRKRNRRKEDKKSNEDKKNTRNHSRRKADESIRKNRKKDKKRFSSLEPFLSIKFAISYCASSSKASIKKLTGRKPSLQEIMADFGFFIHPL